MLFVIQQIAMSVNVLMRIDCVQAAYFNNYLIDPKRPHLPEHPSNRQGGAMPRSADNFAMIPGGFLGGPPHAMMGYNAPRPPFYGGGTYCLEHMNLNVK